MYSLRSIQTYQSRNDTLNAVQLLFTRKFISEMNWFWRCCQTYGLTRLQLIGVIFYGYTIGSSKYNARIRRVFIFLKEYLREVFYFSVRACASFENNLLTDNPNLALYTDIIRIFDV